MITDDTTDHKGSIGINAISTTTKPEIIKYVNIISYKLQITQHNLPRAIEFWVEGN